MIDDVLTLEADDLQTLKWYLDAAFAVHADMRSHTGGMLTLGKGAVISDSTKQKTNARSSTEAELNVIDLPVVLENASMITEIAAGEASYMAVQIGHQKKSIIPNTPATKGIVHSWREKNSDTIRYQTPVQYQTYKEALPEVSFAIR